MTLPAACRRNDGGRPSLFWQTFAHHGGFWKITWRAMFFFFLEICFCFQPDFVASVTFVCVAFVALPCFTYLSI